MKRINELLRRGKGEYWYWGKSAIDQYHGNTPPLLNIATTASLAELAHSYEKLIFPGLEEADALLETEEISLLFTLVDSMGTIPWFNISPLNFLYSPGEDKFIDRNEENHIVRNGLWEGEPKTRRDWEHFLRLTAWGLEEESVYENIDLSASLPGGFLRERDRFFLKDVLTGPYAHRTLDMLLALGWIDSHFPELAELTRIEQNKEFHPEGNVWEHTLETLKYRKESPVNLSLALLFHDLGKAEAEEVGVNRFHGHAQLGARRAERIMEEWGFSVRTRSDVTYLVSHHMMPAAIERLPYYRKKEVIENSLFPLLLELYRCDLSSSFHGLDGYYEACRFYKGFIKNKKNPFRKADGSLKAGAP